MRFHQRVRHTVIEAAALALVALGCCESAHKGDAPPDAAPKASDPALTLDGVVITRGEIEGYTAYFRDLDPAMGHEKCISILLDQHLIPLAFARTEFAELRQQQRERAESLATVLGTSAGYDDMLERTRRNANAETHARIIRQDLPLPEQRWLFEDANVGRVSPVIETAQGFSMVATAEKFPGLTKAYDQAEVLLVRFYTHRSLFQGKWHAELRTRLGALAKDAKKVHPDYRDALPPWLK